MEYVLSSCAGKVTTLVRRAKSYIVESMDKSCSFLLPELIECENIPNNREEIPLPDIANRFSHLRDITSCISELRQDADIELLIGRDLIDAHHVMDHRIGSKGSPYAQKLPLGWVIIDETCLGKVHCPTIVHTNKTAVLDNGVLLISNPVKVT